MKMKTTTDYLDEIPKVIPNIRTDSQLAAQLGISRQSISNYRQNTKHMGIITAVRIAYILQLHPMETISATMYAQAKNEEEQAFWEKEYQKARRD